MTVFNFDTVSHIFWEIHRSTQGRYHAGCGSYLFDGAVYEYDVRTAAKQQLLARVATEVTSVLEIGTYLGHSLLIMLTANPELRVTTIDVESMLAGPAVEVLQRNFPKAQITFVHGNSLDVLPTLTQPYDLFHVDGTHEPDQIRKEWSAILPRRSTDLVKAVFDDYDAIKGAVDEIKNSNEVVAEEIPNCRWRNAYYALRLGRSAAR